MDNKSIRRNNFRLLLQEVWQGHRAVAARDLGFDQPSTVTKYLGTGASRKNIGDALARKIETVASKEHGWLDVAHDALAPTPPSGNRKLQSIEQRINALPDPLREYILLELARCETVQGSFPTQFTRAPKDEDAQAFQQYIWTLYEQAKRRRA